MIRNYFITSFRTLLRNKESASINIIGLAISLTACLFLFMVLKYELSFDTFHRNAKSIYRVVMEYNYPDGTKYTPGVPEPLPAAMRNDFTQIEKLGMIINAGNIQINVLNGDAIENSYKEETGVFFAEPETFEIFDFPWLYGSPRAALTEPNSVVLTQAMAEKYFGTWQNAIGKSIQWKFIQYSVVINLKVNGILQNVPDNTDFPLKIVVSLQTRPLEDPSWRNVNNNRQCFIQLPANVSAEQVAALLPAFGKKHINDDESYAHFVLQPLSGIHFDSRYYNFNKRTISKSTLLSLGVLGIFLLLTASINFINLAIAQVIKKAKEVGVRKVMGSGRNQLIVQFFTETFLILVFSSLLAIVLTQLTIPVLKPVLNLPENYNTFTIEVISFLILLVFVLTFLSGLYPAAVMSRFKPVEAIKSKISNQTIGGVSLRKGLVVVQFIIAQLLIIATLVVLLQLNYFQNAPLGFNKESLVAFAIPADSASMQKMESLRNTLLQTPGIKNVSFHYTPPSWRSNSTSNFRYDQSTKDESFEVNQKFGDPSYIETFGIELIAGRIPQPSDTVREFVVNEAFVRKLGIKNNQDVIGKTITIFGYVNAIPIVGVMKDFNTRSLHSEMEAVALTTDKSIYTKASIKIDPLQTENVLQQLSKIYASFYPAIVFQYEFVDKVIENNYKQEKRLATLTKIFSGLAIFISCLGLYGLISFMAVQRTKEVGIRKVLGASVSDILILFSKEFILQVIIAFGIAAPTAGYFMKQWLNQFAFRIDLGASIFIVSVLGTLTIALITISSQSIKVALSNPVDALKND